MINVHPFWVRLKPSQVVSVRGAVLARWRRIAKRFSTRLPKDVLGKRRQVLFCYTAMARPFLQRPRDKQAQCVVSSAKSAADTLVFGRVVGCWRNGING